MKYSVRRWSFANIYEVDDTHHPNHVEPYGFLCLGDAQQL
jgi:hypothetical protein